MSAKRWLITGVSSGLGRALAEAALGRGDTVVGTARTFASATAFVAINPGRSHGLVLDLTAIEAIPAMVAEGVHRLGGRIDIVVNNAGYALTGAIEEISTAETQAIMATNLLAPLAVCRAALPLMRAGGGGRIINISSMAALESYRGLGLYCASKAALSALTEALAIEAKPFGIHATAVEAAGMRTDFAGRSRREAADRIDAYAAMRSEIAAAFRASDGSQANGPEQSARALLALADMTDPPVHMALGLGALDRIERIFSSRRVEYARFADIGAHA
ncbi:MAG: SDR family NAD(P)-dependent oxidoreductase [Flavobacteriaceae bacterium]